MYFNSQQSLIIAKQKTNLLIATVKQLTVFCYQQSLPCQTQKVALLKVWVCVFGFKFEYRRYLVISHSWLQLMLLTPAKPGIMVYNYYLKDHYYFAFAFQIAFPTFNAKNSHPNKPQVRHQNENISSPISSDQISCKISLIVHKIAIKSLLRI